MRYDGSVIFSTKLDNTGFIKGVKGLPSALNGVKGALSKVGAAVGVAFGIRALVSFGKEAISLASDLEEVQNVVDTAFGSMKQKCEDFAKTSVKTLGMSELSAKQYSSTYMAMGRGMGQSMEDAADMAIETTKRVADVASFYNKSFSEVDTMMKSIWTGETESLKRIGVVMTETNLQAFALSKGITQNIADMDQATKTQLRYAFVMEQTSLAAGDFQRTENSWANQTRLLSEQFNALKTSIGTGLIQALTPAVKALNQLLVMLTRIAEKFREVTATLFGKQTLPAENTADTVNELAAAEDNLAESTDKAAKSAERSLAGFDKLNKLGSNEAESASAGGAGSLSGSLGTVTMDTAQAQNSANQLGGVIEKTRKKFKDFVDWLDISPWTNGFENLKSAGTTIKDVLVTALENSKPELRTSFNGIKTMFKTAAKTYAKIYGESFETITGNINSWTSENSSKIQEFFEGAIGVVSSTVTTVSNIFTDLFLIIRKNWEQYGRPIVDWVSQAVLDIKGWIMTLYNEIVFPIYTEMLGWINRIWNESLKGVIDEVLGFVGRIGEILKLLWEEKIKPQVDWLMTYVVPHIKNFASYILNILGTMFNFVSGSIKNLLTIINGIIEFLIGVFTGDWERAWNGVKKIFDGFKNQISNVIEAIKSVFKSGFEYVRNTVTTIFDQIWTSIKSKINNMLGGVEKLINGIITGINKLINNLNKLNVKVPEALGGGSIGFNIPTLSTVNIPRLAKGAVIPANREFLAVLGDQKSGQNIEAPESLIRKIVREEAGGAGGIKNITLVLSSRLISEAVIEYHNGIVKRVGVTPLKGV